MELYGNLWTVRSGAKTVIDHVTRGVKAVTYIKTVCSQKTSDSGKPITTVSTRRIYKIGGVTMDNLFKEKSAGVMRKGNKVNMEELLGSLDDIFLADMDGTISSYDTYEEISTETYNDYKLTCATLDILHELGYLDEEETDAMRQTAAEMRLKKLEGLEHEEDRP